jgi:hypothetical protein
MLRLAITATNSRSRHHISAGTPGQVMIKDSSPWQTLPNARSKEARFPRCTVDF